MSLLDKPFQITESLTNVCADFLLAHNSVFMEKSMKGIWDFSFYLFLFHKLWTVLNWKLKLFCWMSVQWTRWKFNYSLMQVHPTSHYKQNRIDFFFIKNVHYAFVAQVFLINRIFFIVLIFKFSHKNNF